MPSVERVTMLTCRVPATVVADRGFGTAGNDRALAELGVRRIEEVLAAPWSMCLTTTDPEKAAAWLADYTPVGIEGLVLIA